MEDDKEVSNIRVVKDRFDVRNLHLPTVTIASIVIFCVWLTWSASSERNNIQTQLTEISQTVKTLTDRESKIDELTIIGSKRLDALENKGIETEKSIKENQEKLHSDEIWTKSQHLVWCLEEQISNPGWKCVGFKFPSRSPIDDLIKKNIDPTSPK
jgi:hypothetical protein